VTGGDVELSIGSLYAGDERRIVVALVARPDGEGSLAVNTRASWTLVGGSSHTAPAPRLELRATDSLAEVERGTDTGVLASATSVVTSQRQIEAASAYAAGDVARAAQLTRQNEAELAVAMRAAPAPIAASLGSQMKDYQDQREGFAKNAPGSAEGRAAAKESAAKELGNLNRVVR
jgi:Ca-activated chloride channel family protein